MRCISISMMPGGRRFFFLIIKLKARPLRRFKVLNKSVLVCFFFSWPVYVRVLCGGRYIYMQSAVSFCAWCLLKCPQWIYFEETAGIKELFSVGSLHHSLPQLVLMDRADGLQEEGRLLVAQINAVLEKKIVC